MADTVTIKDAMLRVRLLEDRVSQLEIGDAVATQALSIVKDLIDQNNNHLNHLTRELNDLCLDHQLVKQELRSFIAVFKWMFPSLMVLVAILLGIVSLIATGKLVFS